jgi:hypothetical protein
MGLGEAWPLIRVGSVEGDQQAAPQAHIMAAKGVSATMEEEVSAAMEEVRNAVPDQAEDMTRSKATKNAASPAPAALPPEAMESSEPAAVAIERALHLRVMAEMLRGQADDSRVEDALALAQEVFELEIAASSLENYRSAS